MLENLHLHLRSYIYAPWHSAVNTPGYDNKVLGDNILE